MDVYSGNIVPELCKAAETSQVFLRSEEPYEVGKLTRKHSPPARGALFFWISVFILFLGFLIDGLLSYALLIFVVPVFYGTHEAIHDTLIPLRGLLARGRRIHNNFALIVGCAVQGMNAAIAQPAHLAHHRLGRSDSGYAPDRAQTPHLFSTRLVYYLRLFGINAFALQGLGFALLLFSPHRLPILFALPERQKLKYFLVSQVVVVLVCGCMIYLGGILKFALYEIFFCSVWGLLQNASHYGLKGIDDNTNIHSAWSYEVGPIGQLVTFGTLHHLSHHVLPHVPSTHFRRNKLRHEVETRLNVTFVVKKGIRSYLTDILRQFKGPIHPDKLSTAWCIRTAKKA